MKVTPLPHFLFKNFRILFKLHTSGKGKNKGFYPLIKFLN